MCGGNNLYVVFLGVVGRIVNLRIQFIEIEFQLSKNSKQGELYAKCSEVKKQPAQTGIKAIYILFEEIVQLL